MIAAGRLRHAVSAVLQTLAAFHELVKGLRLTKKRASLDHRNVVLFELLAGLGVGHQLKLASTGGVVINPVSLAIAFAKELALPISNVLREESCPPMGWSGRAPTPTACKAGPGAAKTRSPPCLSNPTAQSP